MNCNKCNKLLAKQDNLTVHTENDTYLNVSGLRSYSIAMNETNNKYNNMIFLHDHTGKFEASKQEIKCRDCLEPFGVYMCFDAYESNACCDEYLVLKNKIH